MSKIENPVKNPLSTANTWRLLIDGHLQADNMNMVSGTMKIESQVQLKDYSTLRAVKDGEKKISKAFIRNFIV